MTFKIGRGLKKGDVISFPIGRLSGNLEQAKDKKMTLTMLAKCLAKSVGIENGELEILGVEFTYSTNKEEKK